MKRIIAAALALAVMICTAACGARYKGTIGGENEFITIDGVRYVLDTGSNFTIADKGGYLCKVSNSSITMRVYSVKGDAEGDYIYALWDWEGSFNKIAD